MSPTRTSSRGGRHSSAFNRPYCRAGPRQHTEDADVSAHGEPRGRLLAALLHVRPDELLRVLLEDLVDLVQARVDVVGKLFVPLPVLLGGPVS
jgi:hypothetical protein